jgi:hypothetical protein
MKVSAAHIDEAPERRARVSGLRELQAPPT